MASQEPMTQATSASGVTTASFPCAPGSNATFVSWIGWLHEPTRSKRELLWLDKYSPKRFKRLLQLKRQRKRYLKAHRHLQRTYGIKAGFNAEINNRGMPRRAAEKRAIADIQMACHTAEAGYRDPLVRIQQKAVWNEFIRRGKMQRADKEHDSSKWREDDPDYDEEEEMTRKVDKHDDVTEEDTDDTKIDDDYDSAEDDYDSADEEYDPKMEQQMQSSGKTKVFKSDLDIENERVDASSNSDHDDDAEHAPDTINTFDISKMPENMREHFMAQMAQFRAYMV